MNGTFQAAQLGEFVPLLVAAVAAVFLTRWGRRRPSIARRRTARGVAVTLALMAALQLGLWLTDMIPDTGRATSLDIEVILFLVGAWAFWTDEDGAFDVFVLWTVGGTAVWTLQAFLRGPAVLGAALFEASLHGILLCVAAYGLFTRERLMRGRSVVRALVALQALFFVLAVLDAVSGQNFFGLHAPPPTPMWLERAAPWPTSLLALDVIYLAAFPLTFWIARRSVSAMLARGYWMTPIARGTGMHGSVMGRARE